MTDAPLRFALLQARRAGDSTAADERAAFAARLGVDESSVRCVDVLSTPLGADTVAGVDAVLVGGAGEFSVLDQLQPIQHFIDFLSRVADGQHGYLPLFASCFGYQALVLGLGGQVAAEPDQAEVGSYDLELTEDGRKDRLFSALPAHFVAQLGHKDRAITLPDCALNLARSARCPFQALTIPGRPVYATQFHPELTWRDNQARFRAYFDHYGQLFGPAEAQRRLDGHRPSPATDALLGRFVDQLVQGRAEGQG